jgi:hypothetical protein
MEIEHEARTSLARAAEQQQQEGQEEMKRRRDAAVATSHQYAAHWFYSMDDSG